MKKISMSILALVAMLFTTSVFAASFGDLAGNAEKSVANFKVLAVQIGFFIGIVLFIIGLFMIYKDQKEPGRGHLKNGLIAMIVGSGLLAMQTMIDTTLETGFGSEATTIDEEGFGGN